MTIRSSKHNSQGYTLLEMLAVLGVVAIVIGFATPSLLALNKPLREGTTQFKSTLNLIRSKAISSGQSYRIRPKYPVASQYIGNSYPGTPHNFVVEFAANCRVNRYGAASTSPAAPAGSPDGWQIAWEFDLDLPEAVGIVNDTTSTPPSTLGSTSRTFTPANAAYPTTVTFDSYLNWEICYDNRGLADRNVTVVLKDFQGNNQATSTVINVQTVGLDIKTRDKNGTILNPVTSSDPVF
jgi:prepilin-type N-terminal cleavage/methylation domain-containing protein